MSSYTQQKIFWGRTLGPDLWVGVVVPLPLFLRISTGPAWREWGLCKRTCNV